MSQVPTTINDALFGDVTLEWQMTEAERCAVVALLQRTRPEIVIEVGTDRGGSLLVFSRHARKVYSLDIDPTCSARLTALCPNAEFITGPSGETLPPLLARLEAERAPLGLVLIDASHQREGVRLDVESVLRYRPSQPLWVLLHDSFNPDCRQGMLDADWAANPHVQFVELDFVTGQFVHDPRGRQYRQMWCGLALAYLDPTPRTHALVVSSKEPLLYDTVWRHSAHRLLQLPRYHPERLLPALARRLRRLVGGGRGEREATAHPG